MSSPDRKVIADRDYQRGDVIVPQELPVVHILNQEYKFIHCDECFSSSHPLKRCGSCGKMAYCSRSCQVINWKGGHKWECSVFKTSAAAATASSKSTPDFFGLNGDLERFILRAWLLYRDASSKLHTTEGTLPTSEKRKFADLKSNSDLFRQNRSLMTEFDSEHVPLFKRYDLVTEENTEDDLFSVRCKLRTNSFGIRPLFGGSEDELGRGVYLASSAFNHSCRPNASQLWDSDETNIKMIAVLYIKRGDEICISYTDRLTTTADRRAYLERMYCFTCQCERCTTTAASEELTRREANQLRAIDQNTERCAAVEALCRSTVGIKTADLDLQVLRLNIAKFDLLKDFLPAADPELVHGMLINSKCIMLLTLERLNAQISNKKKHRTNALGGDLQQSQWSDEEWLAQTDQRLAIIVGRDHPECVKFRKSIQLYNQTKTACKLSGLSI